MVKETDGYGKETSYIYDTSNNLTSLVDANGNTTSYEYDVFGNLISVTDGNGNKTSYSYNASYGLMSVTTALGQSASYERDALGRISKYSDFAGNETTYTYDSCGRVLLMLDSEGLTVFSYDKGYLCKISDGENSKKYAYDSLGRVISTEDENGNVLRYSYDSYGNITKIEGVGHTVSYTYDEYGRISSSTDENGVSVVYSYDETSRVNKESYSNGIVKDYSYDTCGRVNREIYQNSKGEKLFSYEYSFGKNGELIAVKETTGTAVTNISYVYDNCGYIEKECYLQGDSSYSVVYEYDSAGNRTSKSVSISGDISSFITEELKAGTTQYEYNAVNQLVKETVGEQEVIYTYDASGNLIKKTGETDTVYSYNARNELTGAKVQKNGGTTEEAYSYDVAGVRCAKKTAYSDIEYITYSLGGVSFLWAIKENDVVKTTYQRALGLVSENVNGNSFIYAVDALENVRALIDSEENVTDTFDYDAYGVYLNKTGNTYNVYGYKCEETDELTGLIYLRARYYEPGIGRFTSEDTYGGNIGNPITLNRYAYVNNNPISYSDPNGHMATMIEALISISIRSIMDNMDMIRVNAEISAMFAVADAALDNNQEGKDYVSIAISGLVSGFAFGAIFTALGAIGEVFATVKLLTMLVSGLMIDAGFYFAGASFSEGNYLQSLLRFATSAWALHSWGKSYKPQEQEIANAAKQEIKETSQNIKNKYGSKINSTLKSILEDNRGMVDLDGFRSAKKTSYGKSIRISEKKMYQLGDHFNKHGRDMGYVSKKEYEQAARDFFEQNKDKCEIYEGIFNNSRGIQSGKAQYILRQDGKQLIISKETSQIIDFYEGTSLDAFINVERLQ